MCMGFDVDGVDDFTIVPLKFADVPESLFCSVHASLIQVFDTFHSVL